MIEQKLKKLVKFSTITQNHKENKKALEWIKRELSGLPLYFNEFEFNNFPSLVVSTHKGKKSKIWLQAHLDVVEASKNAFSPEKKGNRIYGRGAADMKFAIACYIKLLKNLGQNLSDYDISLVITTDEEIGGFNGTKQILKQGYRAEVSVLPDGGYNWQLEKTAKGALALYVKTKGKSVHSSRPWEGDNALEKLIKFSEALKKEFPGKSKSSDTVSVNKIESGTAFNKVPHKAEGWIDIRFNPENSIENVRKKVNKVKNKFSRIEINEIMNAQPLKVDTSNHYIQSIKKLSKNKIDFSMSYGASDARFLYDYNIIPLVFAPKGGNHHSENEWIDIPDSERFYNLLEKFVKQEGKS